MFYFDGEVNVFGGIDDVEVVFWQGFVYVFLECGGGSGLDCDVMFLFLFYLVYGGSVVMYFIDFVVFVGVEQDVFGCGGFVGIDVGYDVEVMVMFDGSGVGYGSFLIFWNLDG